MDIYYQDDTVEIRVSSINDLETEKFNKTQQRIERRRQSQQTYYQKTKQTRSRKTKEKLTHDSLFKLKHNLKNLIRNSIKNQGFDKNTKTYQILGCSYNEFKHYIEQQFCEGMSWENYGAWEYDHITPISWGITEHEIIALNHYTNFQPLWKEDNRTKSNKFSGHPTLLT